MKNGLTKPSRSGSPAESEKDMRFEIYRNYGVLGAEKRSIYTYGGEHFRAFCSDKLIVKLPENKSFKIHETVTGEFTVESSWGWQYAISEVLKGNEKPCFFALDDHKRIHRVDLEIVEQ